VLILCIKCDVKKKYWILSILAVAMIILAVVPIKSKNLPDSSFEGPVCKNTPLPVRVDLIAGNTLQKETNKLGEDPCPTVQLSLYVF
jgi:hypothetical protein